MAGEIPAFKGGVVYLDTALLDKITAEMQPKAAAVVNKYGLAMAREASTVHPWKVDTSALSNSILSESKMTGDMQFTISDGVEYGIFLEFGTSKMPAYPFFVQAVETWTARFLKAFEDLFK